MIECCVACPAVPRRPAAPVQRSQEDIKTSLPLFSQLAWLSLLLSSLFFIFAFHPISLLKHWYPHCFIRNVDDEGRVSRQVSHIQNTSPNNFPKLHNSTKARRLCNHSSQYDDSS